MPPVSVCERGIVLKRMLARSTFAGMEEERSDGLPQLGTQPHKSLIFDLQPRQG